MANKFVLSQKTALEKLAVLPAAERAKLLKISSIRNAVLNSGANVTFYTGRVNGSAKSVLESLGNIYIGLIQRKNRRGELDGLGALGGLAERTKREEFESMRESERVALAKAKDDVEIVDDKAVLLSDMDKIRVNNVMREVREELADLGITHVMINPADLVLIPMPHVKDDNYIINKWNGTGVCYAVSPYCHIYEDKRSLIDSIVAVAGEKDGGEAKEFKKVKLVDALMAWGNRDTESLEDGRSAIRDYRYPHEYLVTWALAAMLLKYDPQKIKLLALEVQTGCDHLISFAEIARATKQTMKDVADILHLPVAVLKEIEKSCASMFKGRTSIKSHGTTR